MLNSYAATYNAENVINTSTGFRVGGVRSTNPIDYAPNTEERYIASMARQKGITFEEAKKINDEEVALLLKNRPMALDEEIRYKTVDKKAGTINSNEQDFRVYIATEVRYLWSKVYSKPLQIERIGKPIMYIQGFSIEEIDGGGFDIEQTSSKARISQTAVLRYPVSVRLELP